MGSSSERVTIMKIPDDSSTGEIKWYYGSTSPSLIRTGGTTYTVPDDSDPDKFSATVNASDVTLEKYIKHQI